jgi:hypothetical protein
MKGRTRAEVDEIVRWLTGCSAERLDRQLAAKARSKPSLIKRHAPSRVNPISLRDKRSRPRRDSVEQEVEALAERAFPIVVE